MDTAVEMNRNGCLEKVLELYIVNYSVGKHKFIHWLHFVQFEAEWHAVPSGLLCCLAGIYNENAIAHFMT